MCSYHQDMYLYTLFPELRIVIKGKMQETLETNTALYLGQKPPNVLFIRLFEIQHAWYFSLLTSIGKRYSNTIGGSADVQGVQRPRN